MTTIRILAVLFLLFWAFNFWVLCRVGKDRLEAVVNSFIASIVLAGMAGVIIAGLAIVLGFWELTF